MENAARARIEIIMDLLRNMLRKIILKLVPKLVTGREMLSFAKDYVDGKKLAVTRSYLYTGNDKDWKYVRGSDEFLAVHEQVKKYFPRDYNRVYLIYSQLKRLDGENIQGDLAEVGVYKGYTARLINLCSPARELHLFDTFEGQPDNVEASVDGKEYGSILKKISLDDTSLEQVQNLVGEAPNIHYYQGYFPDTASPVKGKTFSMAHLDGDQYQTIKDSLEFFYPRVSAGGVLIVHDYGIYKGVRQAVREYFTENGINTVKLVWPDAQGSLLIFKP